MTMALNHPDDEGGASTSNTQEENETANAASATAAAPASTDGVATTTSIKTMKLYTHLDRIDKELEASGLLLPTKKNGVSSNTTRLLTATQLSPFDCLHYLGDAAVRRAVQSAAIDTGRTCTVVLDLGSGLGGTARLVASWCDGCRVDALELQPDLHARAEQLTAACGLSEKVRHYCGDVLSDHHEDDGVTMMVPNNYVRVDYPPTSGTGRLSPFSSFSTFPIALPSFNAAGTASSPVVACTSKTTVASPDAGVVVLQSPRIGPARDGSLRAARAAHVGAAARRTARAGLCGRGVSRHDHTVARLCPAARPGLRGAVGAAPKSLRQRVGGRSGDLL